MVLSSMTRARRPRSSPGEGTVNGFTARVLPRRTVNQQVLPCPTSLSTPRSPPISSTSRRQIARPSPVPPKRRVVELSAWLKAWNRRPRASGEMPIPVSRTSTRTVVCRRLRRTPEIRDIKILAVTGRSDMARAVVAAGADACVTKPFDWSLVDRELERFLDPAVRPDLVPGPTAR